MSKVIKSRKVINEKAQNAINELERDMERESRLSTIQVLIPLDLKAIEAILQEEIMTTAGNRYKRAGDIKRWGSNPGSVFLGDQKVKVPAPRARSIAIIDCRVFGILSIQRKFMFVKYLEYFLFLQACMLWLRT